MSSLRQDVSHSPGPTGGSRTPAPEAPSTPLAEGFLSVVVPAKNEAASLPQLVEEIAAALRPLRDGGGPAARSAGSRS